MSEEIKNRNAELADEAVEEVTGGYTIPDNIIERLVERAFVCPACQSTYTCMVNERVPLPDPCPHCGYIWVINPQQLPSLP